MAANPDTEPESVALSRMVERLAAGEADAVGATVCGADGVVESRGGIWRPWLARAVSIDFGKRLEDTPADLQPSYLSGASMLVGRRFLETAGPMREDYFLYAEEVEWCLRAVRLGLTLSVAPAARVIHHQGAATGSVSDPRHRSRLAVYLDERNKLLITRDLYEAPLLAVALATSGARFPALRPAGCMATVGLCLAGLVRRPARPARAAAVPRN